MSNRIKWAVMMGFLIAADIGIGACLSPPGIACGDGWCAEGYRCSLIDLTTCIKSGCGNGVAEVDEECDDGNLNDNDDCLSTCNFNDGRHDAGAEKCESFWFRNEHGCAATFTEAGSMDLDNAFFTAQGTNGRSCGTCHVPEVGWSINGKTVTTLFNATRGSHPIFASTLDTDTPTADMSTVQARWEATTMLRQGKFARSIGLPASRDYDLVDFADPFSVSTPFRLFWFRRPMPTANFRSHTVHWDSVMTVGTDLRAGLMKQARSNITGSQQGAPAPETVIAEIADYERQLWHAQIYCWGAGRLDEDGARGGPEHAAAQPLVAGRFDLYDAWQNSDNAYRRQIWRGQEVFNKVNLPTGHRCGGCHDIANNGQNLNGAIFDIGASRPELASPDMAVFTFRSRVDGSLTMSTDPGLGLRSGRFADLNKFKTPNLRGLAARAPYFHGGTAKTLEDVVRHYEVQLGFDFTSDEENDLIAFLKAL
jgi:cytochrome c peroxidase